MNTNQSEPISAFSVYSQKSKRKRRLKSDLVTNLISKGNITKDLKNTSQNSLVATDKTIYSNLTNDILKLASKVNKKSRKKDNILDKNETPLINSKKTRSTILSTSATTEGNSIKENHRFSADVNKKLKRNIILENNRICSTKLKSKNSLKNPTLKRNDVEKYNTNMGVHKKFKKKKNILENIETICSKNMTLLNIRSEESNDDTEENEGSMEGFDDLPKVTFNTNISQSNSEDDSADVDESKQNKIPKIQRREISELSENINGSSVDVATGLFEWMIKPVSVQKFMREYWESTPLFVKRHVRNYYSALLSTPEIDSILRNNNILFGKHLDVTSYSDGVRETHNLNGRAQPHVVWDYYSNGCSIRMLNPQAFVKKILALNTTLQEYFGCFVGSNVYLTPPDSQGFAPHYDDIEAFVLQIEGKKQWKVYRPRNKHEYLDRFSSPNFSQEEIGSPMLDIVLEAGDMLYFPRGFIHQGCTVAGEHSLHITLSAYQRTAWVDLLEKVVPMALRRAAHENISYRRGLPIGYLQSLGLGVNPSTNIKARRDFIKKAKVLVAKLADHLDDIDTGVDQMGIQFMHDALPPVLTPDESKRSVYGDGLHMKENGILSPHKGLTSNAKIKLLRANVCRLIEEEGEMRLYYTVDNSLEYHAEEPQYLLLSQETVFLVQHLIHIYPEFVAINQIPYPYDNLDERYQAVCDLWDRGLLLTDRPLEQMEDEKINE